MTTPEEILKKMRADGSTRYKKYYEEHKAEILKKRKEKRDEAKKAQDKKEEDPEETPARVYRNKGPKENGGAYDPEKLKNYSYQFIINHLTEYGTAPIYLNNIKQLQRIFKFDNFDEAFKNTDEKIKLLDNSKQVSGKPYSINSRKSMIQTILFLITQLKINLPKEDQFKYVEKFELYKIESQDQTEEKNSETTYNFNDYLKVVKNAYGETSKQYIISLLYSIYGFRDDLELVYIKNFEEEAGGINYIVIDSAPEIRIILNDYKTAGQYKRKIIAIPFNISEIIKDYVRINQIAPNTLIFGDINLIKYIIYFNKKIGYDISINEYRRMLISNTDAKTPADRLELSKKMNHAPQTSKKYIRKVENA